MVGVAQLVEPWIVIPVVVGSSPIVHPKSWTLSMSVQAIESEQAFWSNGRPVTGR